MALADQGKDVVVLMHSYGGVPGSAALEGLGKTARVEKGEKGGVARLVYVCSFALREGERMPDAGNMEKLRQYDGLDEKVCLNSTPTFLPPQGSSDVIVSRVVLLGALLGCATPKPASARRF